MTRPIPFRTATLLLAAVLPAGPVAGQAALDVYTGLEAGDGLSVFCEVGDLDGDGVVEHLVGAPAADGERGTATLFDGADGTVLRTFQGPLPGARFGHAVSGTGDLDGDGVPDLAVGAPGAPGSGSRGTVHLFSGAHHGLLDLLEGPETGSGFGFALSALPDADADGVLELLVGAPFTGADRGRALVFSGSDRALLASRDGAADGDTYGYSLDGSLAMGEGSPEPVIGQSLGLEGSPEPIIGAPQLGNGGAGYLEILELPGFTPVTIEHGEQPGDRFGLVVAWVGDVDADGSLDHLVSAVPGFGGGGPTGLGTVSVVSGADGTELQRWQAELPDTGFGEAAAGLGDVDGDGHDDVAVGAPRSDGAGHPGSLAGTVFVFDGDTGDLAHMLHGDPGAQLGTHLGYAGDVDLDGRADAGLGAPGADTNGVDAGLVLILTFERLSVLDGGQLIGEPSPTLAPVPGSVQD